MEMQVDGPVAPCAYDCRSFDLEAYHSELLRQRADQFSSVQAVVFLTVPPHASAQGLAPGDQLLAVGYSTGIIRLFALKDAVSGWFRNQQLAQPCLSWKAHEGGVSCLHLLSHGGEPLLLSGGKDGCIRVWSVLQLTTNCSSWLTDYQRRLSASETQGTPFFHPPPMQLQPQHTVHLLPPGGWGAWGAGQQAVAGVQCMAVDSQQGLVFAGSSDGRCHVLPLTSASNTAPAIAGSHLAGVLSMDMAPTMSGQLVASGGEDGFVRLWDLRQQACSAVVRPAAAAVGASGTALDGNTPAAALKQHVRSSPAVTAVRFGGAGGAGSAASWLLCGLAGGAPALTTWSLDAGMVAHRTTLECVPQVLGVLPGEVLVAGNSPNLYRYNFSGQLSSTHALAPQLKSVLALDICQSASNASGTASAGDTTQHRTVAPGAVVLGGAGGCVDVLSHYSTRLATTHMQEDIELLSMGEEL